MDQIILDQLLFAAIQQANHDLVENALKQGANPNAILPWLHNEKCFPNCSPFYLALYLLIGKDTDGYFHFSLVKPVLKIIQSLLQYGATIYSVDRKMKETSIASALPYIMDNFFDTALSLYTTETQIMKCASEIITTILQFCGPISMDADLCDSFVWLSEELEQKKSHQYHNVIVHDLLRHGSIVPEKESFHESEYYTNLFIWIWPQLMVFYCLKKKNILP